MGESCKGNILMCPFMAVGHTMPMLELADHLTALDFSVTFVFPGRNLLERAVSKENRNPRISYEVVDFGELEEEGGTGYTISPGLRQVQWTELDIPKFIKEMLPKYLAIKSRIQQLAESPRTLCVILDPMLFSDFIMKDLTALPTYVFSPFSATSIACFNYVMTNGFTPPAISIPQLGFQLFQHDFPSNDCLDHPGSDIYKRRQELIQTNCKGMLVNTWEGIELGSIEALRGSESLCGFPKPFSDSVFPVGPMISTSKCFFKSDQEEYTRCKEWLDAREPSSVLLICFGSWLLQSDEQMEELAMGLEASGVSFVWVLKSGDKYEWLEGFVERTRDRGLVFLGWAPQQYILSHQSVGGFVMTCGWNSVMEALVLNPRGIALVAWPIYQDHLPTCRLLVDKLGICVEVRGSADGLFGTVSRADVARAATLAIRGPDAVNMRSGAFELGKVARESIKPGGSSFNHLQAFGKEILSGATSR